MTDQEAITRVRGQFVASFNRGDISTLSDLITEDNVAMPPNRPMLRGKDECRAFWQEGFAAAESRFSVTPLETDIAGDIAVDLFRWTMDSAPRAGGEPVHDEGKNLWIWRRQKDNGWKLARAIWNSDLPHGGVWSGGATASSGGSALTTEDEQTIRDLVERQWPASWLAGDVEKILAMCAEDVVYMPAGHPALRGHAELRAWLKQFPKTLKFEQPLSHVEGDGNKTVAYATFDAVIEVDGKPVNIVGKVLCSLRKEASGRWVAHSVCWNFDGPVAASA